MPDTQEKALKYAKALLRMDSNAHCDHQWFQITTQWSTNDIMKGHTIIIVQCANCEEVKRLHGGKE